MNKSQIETMANRMEALLPPGSKITGGTLTPRWIRFTIAANGETRYTDILPLPEPSTLEAFLDMVSFVNPNTVVFGTAAEDGGTVLFSFAGCPCILITGQDREDLEALIEASLRRWPLASGSVRFVRTRAEAGALAREALSPGMCIIASCAIASPSSVVSQFPCHIEGLGNGMFRVMRAPVGTGMVFIVPVRSSECVPMPAPHQSLPWPVSRLAEALEA